MSNQKANNIDDDNLNNRKSSNKTSKFRPLYIALIIFLILLVIFLIVNFTVKKQNKTISPSESPNELVSPNQTSNEKINEIFPERMLKIVKPEDKKITKSAGDVSIETWNPITITPLEENTNFYFIIKNSGVTPVTVQLASWNDFLNAKPQWSFHSTPLFDAGDFIYQIQAGASKMLEFYISNDVQEQNGEESFEFPFNFIIKETGETINIPIKFIAQNDNEPFRKYSSSGTIYGRILSSDNNPVSNANVMAFFLTANDRTRAKTDEDGYYRLNVPYIEDLMQVLGDRKLPYSNFSYFLVAEKEGYSLGYKNNITLSKQNNGLKIDFTLKPLEKKVSYKKIGEFSSDGPYGYWWVKFIDATQKIAAVQGQHPPNLEDSGHVVMLDLNGKELWRFKTDSACWGFDVSSDGKLIAVGSKGSKIYVLNDEGQLLWQKDLSTTQHEEVNSVCFSPDGKYLAGGRRGKTILLDSKTGKEIWARNVDVDNIRWSQDGNYIVTGQNQLTVLSKEGNIMWKVNLGIYPLYLHLDNENNIYAAGKTRELDVFSIDGELLWRRPIAQTANKSSTAISKDGSLILVHTFNGLIYDFNKKGDIIWERPIYLGDNSRIGPGSQGLEVSDDGKEIVIGDGAYGVSVFDENGNLLWRNISLKRTDFKYDIDIHGYQDGVLSVDISQDKKYIVAGYADSTIRIFELENGK